MCVVLVQSALHIFILASMASPGWEFDAPEDVAAWQANHHLSEVKAIDGTLHARATDSDPFFTCSGLAIPTNPRQYIVIRMKADKAGRCDLFWTGSHEGPYDGLSEQKKTSFQVKGTGEWEDIVLWPFWHAEGSIHTLRFDVYYDAAFAIDAIRIQERPETQMGVPEAGWKLAGDAGPWQVHPAASEHFAPVKPFDSSGLAWATVRAKSDTEVRMAVLWAQTGANGLESEDFPVDGDGQYHTYNVELQGLPAWQGEIAAFGLRIPDGAALDSAKLGAAPSGPPEVEVDYFGFEDAVNRAERPCPVLVRLCNRGGETAPPSSIRLETPEGVTVAEGGPEQATPALPGGDRISMRWHVVASRPGEWTLRLTGAVLDQSGYAELRFLPPYTGPAADYVPAPMPVETDIDVCAFYFPGWNTPAKWEPIRNIAPVRKPLLGYYDEANPECVDWQIKWARENGISCFLVDWYWVQGQQILNHWFDAYRKARYRDLLDVAIMWANHNPPGTHSREDWRTVTRHWIDHYFNLPAYYQIDGKPAVFLWSPDGLRNDLGGSDAVHEALAESQRMARDAGHDGIAFVAMAHQFTESIARQLAEEGFMAATSYHEWGAAFEMSPVPRLAQFKDVAASAPEAWRTKARDAEPLVYYPLVDTGWDDRPWHGQRGQVIAGRTVSLFRDLLESASAFCRQEGLPRVVLGPMNEWGEGSYIEPCTEFGFGMLEQVRAVFAKGEPNAWPLNIAPSDVGLGGYDLPSVEVEPIWTFEHSPGGWAPMMNLGELTCSNSLLTMRTLSDDAALVVETGHLDARKAAHLQIKMRLTASEPLESAAQMFWSFDGQAMTEATSVKFPVRTDGVMRTHEVDLSQHPRWRGVITRLRFDPCSVADAQVEIDEIRLTSGEAVP
jgi:hypothetical protein